MNCTPFLSTSIIPYLSNKWGAVHRCGVFFLTVGLEPIAEQHAGGMLLPPVQTLVATSILSRQDKMHIKSNRG